MQRKNNLRVYDPLDASGKPDADRQRLAVSVFRNLENDLKLACQLEELTVQMNLLIRSRSLEKMTSDEFEELDSIGNQIDEIARDMRNGRKALGQMLLDAKGNQTTVRQFIELVPQPLRHQIDDLRNRIMKKSHNVRAQLTSGQTVVFYSVNAYRKLLQGLMDVPGPSGQYQAKGQTPKLPTGRLIRKTC